MASFLARKKHANCNINLSEDIIHYEILTRLPVKTLLRFRSVCKSWQALISNPNFSKSHLTRTSINPNYDSFIFRRRENYEDTNTTSRFNLSATIFSTLDNPYSTPPTYVELVGSINGLVCLAIRHGVSKVIHFSLWNPATKQCKEIPPLEKNYSDRDKKNNYSFGFGFDPLADEYKVICISTRYKLSSSLQGYFYSSNADSWNELVHSDFVFPCFYSTCSIIVNGCPYWLYINHDKAKAKFLWSVVSFDVHHEVFRWLPDLILTYNGEVSWLLVNLKDSLAMMVHTSGTRSNGLVDVYTLDEAPSSCGGVWCKTYTVGPIMGEVHWLWHCFKNGEIMFNECRKKLLYDPKTNAIKSICNGERRLVNGFSYIESLVFLEGMKPLDKGKAKKIMKKFQLVELSLNKVFLSYF